MLIKVIEKNCIQQIGIDYADLIISRDNFVATIKELNKKGFYIVEISWWQYKRIGEESHFSMGGPKDKTNNDFYWGETNFSRDFFTHELKN